MAELNLDDPKQLAQSGLNQYGAQAMRHYRQFLPDRYEAIPPEARTEFFVNLGREAAQRIGDLTVQYAGPDRLDEGHQEKTGRLGTAKARAIEQVNKELVLPDPPDAQDPDLVPTSENSDPQPDRWEWEPTGQDQSQDQNEE